MKRNTIKILLIFGILSIISIISVQIYFFQKAYTYEEKELNQSIRIALRRVAEGISNYTNTTLPNEGLIYQYSSNYYIVNINDIIDPVILEHYLVREFKNMGLNIGFEYAIYDCQTDAMVYGNYISNNTTHELAAASGTRILPKCDDYVYYFGINFPARKKYIIDNMKYMYFFSFILLILVLFFGYAMLVILKQRRLSEVQKVFINNITHEFKTPLTSISLSAEVINNKEILNEQDRFLKYVNIIKNQSVFLLAQIDKIVHLTGRNKLSHSVHREKVNMHEIIEQVKLNYEFKVWEKKGEIILNLDQQLIYFYGDKLLITNMISNIIDNSYKYSKEHVQIKISLQKRNNFVELSIEDNGIGIPEDKQSRIFNEFYRIQDGNVHDVKGFGLGLNYVQRVSKLHKWDVRVSSKTGQGTRIIILIPKKHWIHE